MSGRIFYHKWSHDRKCICICEPHPACIDNSWGDVTRSLTMRLNRHQPYLSRDRFREKLREGAPNDLTSQDQDQPFAARNYNASMPLLVPCN